MIAGSRADEKEAMVSLVMNFWQSAFSGLMSADHNGDKPQCH